MLKINLNKSILNMENTKILNEINGKNELHLGK